MPTILFGVRFFEKEKERYNERKDIRLSFSQVQKFFEFVTKMRWLKVNLSDGEVIISKEYLEKAAIKYNFSPKALEKMYKYSTLENDNQIIRWMPFIALSMALTSINIYDCVKNVICLYSLENVIVNIPDIKQILQYYSHIDKNKEEKLKELCDFIENER